jgi:glycosyltransferase involved in cell wall biosynthesis
VRSISVILPAFNEEANILAAVRATLATLDARRLEGEVIVVDDGSSDATSTLVLAVADGRVRVLRHPRNIGYGAALKTGVVASRMEHVFFTDADLQFDIGELERLEGWARGWDIVVGYRAPRQDPWPRRLNAWVWNRLVDGLFDLGVRDIDCAFKLFHRRVFSRVNITSVGAFVNSEILVRSRAAGFRVKEVPVTHFPRTAGTATGANPRVIARAVVELGGLYAELRGVQRVSAARLSSA